MVDPVLVSTSGGVLLDADGQAALTEALFPLATLVTPNVPEVAALLGEEETASDEAELVQQGRRLLEFGSQAILLKGGHHYAGHDAAEDAVDLLDLERRPRRADRIEARGGLEPRHRLRAGLGGRRRPRGRKTAWSELSRRQELCIRYADACRLENVGTVDHPAAWNAGRAHDAASSYPE